jgi:ABC-type lipoprotein release transport system permease subunit
LPSLVFRSKVEGAGVLQIGGENDGLVAGLSRKLNTKVPSIKGNKNKVEILGSQVLVGKRIESRDGVSKGTRVSNMFPSESRQTR